MNLINNIVNKKNKGPAMGQPPHNYQDHLNRSISIMDNKIGNISTIIKFLALTMAGWIISTLAANGYNLGIDTTTLASVIGAIIGLGLAYIDAKYPNSFSWLGNAPTPIDSTEPVLNPEYEVGDDGC